MPSPPEPSPRRRRRADRARRRRRAAIARGTLTTEGALERRALLATFLVTSPADAGAGSLRQAILDANAAAGADTIAFALPGTAVHVLAPLAPLPAVTDPVAIDGATQPGYRGRPLVELRGDLAGPGADGLVVATSNSLVRGLAINRFDGAGVVLLGAGATRNVVVACALGTDPDGRLAPGLGSDGVRIFNGAGNTIGGTAAGAGNTIGGAAGAGVRVVGAGGPANVVAGNRVGLGADGRTALPNGVGLVVEPSALAPAVGGVLRDNLVGGNRGDGIVLRAAAAVLVQGNLVGTDATGRAAVANGGAGVRLIDGVGVTVGGPAARLGNLVAGNVVGIDVRGGSDVVVQGNLVGIDGTGTRALPNRDGGLALADHAGALVGGAGPGAGNVVSGNGGAGVLLGPGTRVVTLAGNLIGTDLVGTRRVPNAGPGVVVRDAGPATIGGTAAGAGNVITANLGGGVLVTAAVAPPADTVVLGNRIGTDAAGAPLGNAGFGVQAAGAARVRIGDGTLAGSNRIERNAGPGVAVLDAASAALRANRLDANAGLGIDLGGDGVTPNDPGDPDGGPNGMLNFPTFTAQPAPGGGLRVVGRLDTPAGRTVTVEIYASPAPDPSGHGEGATFLGAVLATATPLGPATFDVLLPAPPAGWRAITATATDDGLGVTSEFGAVAVAGGNRAPRANAGPDRDALEGDAIAFSGLASTDPDGDALAYTWDFGDGSPPASGATPRHAYADDGVYTATLTVRDGYGGVSTDTLRVTVRNAAPELLPSAFREAPGTASWGAGLNVGAAVAAAGDRYAVGAPSADGVTPGAVAIVYLDANPSSPTYNTVRRRVVVDPTGNPASGFGSALAAQEGSLYVGAPGAGRVYLIDADPASPRFGQVRRVLETPDAAGDRFGAALAVVETGLLVGAPEGAGGAGVAYRIDPATGAVVRTFANPSPAPGDAFGAAVAALGPVVLIGAPGDDAAGPDAGAAYRFNPDLAPPLALLGPAPGARFGAAVAFAADALAVGAPGANGGAGAVHVSRPDGTPAYDPLTAPAGAGGRFGVALAGSATELLVGAPEANLGAARAGAGFVFRAGSGRLLAALQTAAPETGGTIGAAVAFFDDDVLLGAPGRRAAFFHVRGEGLVQDDLAAGGDDAPVEPVPLGLSASIVREAPAGLASVVLHGGVTDPSAVDARVVTISWGDGSPDTVLPLPPGVQVFAVPHRYEQDLPDSLLIRVRVADDDGGVVTGAIPITVLNAAPVVDLGPDREAIEGDTVAFDGAFSDPGVRDTHTFRWSVTAANGQVVPTADTQAFRFVPRSEGAYVVRYTVTDDAGAATTDSVVVTVRNAPPRIEALALDRTAIDEGGAVVLEGRFTDPGDDAHELRVNWGDGLIEVVRLPRGERAFRARHVYLDDPPSPTDDTFRIVATVADDAGATDSRGLDLAVRNVAPAARIAGLPGANAAPDAGRVYLTAVVSDPGILDARAYEWALVRPGAPDAVLGTGPDLAFLPPVGGAYTLRLRVADGDGGVGTDTAVFYVGTDGADAPDLAALVAPGAGRLIGFGYGGNDTLDAGTILIPTELDGGPGDDRIRGGPGADLLRGGRNGNDTFEGGAGDDTIVGEGGSDQMAGNAGDDRYAIAPGTGPAPMSGPRAAPSVTSVVIDETGDPTGFDTVDFSGAVLGVRFSLDPALAGTPQPVDGASNAVTFRGVLEGLVGSGLGDRLEGNGAGNRLDGGGGDDLLFGGDGLDSLEGGTGNDTVDGGPGGDTIAGGDGADSLTGGPGNDTFAGGSGNDLIFGGDDADSLSGGLGNDSLDAGPGDDTVGGGSDLDPGADLGRDTLSGGSGNDLIFGGEDADSLDGGSGDDTIDAGAGDDSVAGGDDADTLLGGSGNDTFVGGGGNDLIFGGDDADSLDGGLGNDSLDAGAGNDVLAGGDDADTLTGGFGNDTFAGGSGNDLIFGGEDADSLDGGSGNDSLDAGAGDDSVAGGGDADVVLGGDGSDTVSGGAGNDLIFGGEDADSLEGGLGNDGVSAGPGDDTVWGGDGGGTPGSGSDTLAGGSGNDLIFGGDDADTLDGGLGNDTIGGDGGADSLLGGSGNDVLAGDTTTGAPGADTILGGSGNDLIFGGEDADSLDGGTGNDTVRGEGGGDSVAGGAGNDLLVGDDPGAGLPGGDTLVGGTGNDLIFGGDDADSLDGGQGADSLDGGAGNDTIVGGLDGDPLGAIDADTIQGGAGNDILFGGDGIDSIEAGSGDDTAAAGAGDDVVRGGPGADSLVGGDGNDDLRDESGANTLVGGLGNDLIFGGDDADLIDGGAGDDTVGGGAGDDGVSGGAGDDLLALAGNVDMTLASLPSPVAGRARLQLLGAGGVSRGDSTLDGVERARLVGGPGANRIDASTFVGPVSLLGGDGPDTLLGGPADDALTGGAGDDSLAGGGGNDAYLFGPGALGADAIAERPASSGGDPRDGLDFTAFGGPVAIDLRLATPQVVNPGRLTLTILAAASVEDITGGAFDDRLIGSDLSNRLAGGAGQDFLAGLGGDDVLQGGATQLVFLDFDAFARSGLRPYTTAERDQVESRLVADFAAFNVTFTQDRPDADAGPFSTLRFNDPRLGGREGGKVDAIDWRNLDPDDAASINVLNLLGGSGTPPLTSENVVAMTATVAAHELSHLLGLLHGDAFGPVGSGIPESLDPALFTDGRTPPGGYPGPREAVESIRHVTAAPASLGSTLYDALEDVFLGERESIKLAFAAHGAAAIEPPGAHEAIDASAPELPLRPIAVPNLLRVGRAAGGGFAVDAAAIVGTLGLRADGTPERDVYRLAGRAGDLFAIEVMSQTLARAGAPIDGLLRVVDAAGRPVDYYGAPAQNDNSSQNRDPVLIDLRLPADGTYYVIVDAAAASPARVGGYELFAYRFALGADSAAGGDTLYSGAGADLIIGGPSDETIARNPRRDTVLRGAGRATYLDTAPPGDVDAGPDRAAVVGETVAFAGTFTDFDGEATPVLSWTVADAAGQVVAVGAGAAFRFTPAAPGAYVVTFRVRQGDTEASDAARLVVTPAPADAEAPASRVTATLDRGGPEPVVVVTLTATDGGGTPSGVASFDVYTTFDNVTFTPLALGLPATRGPGVGPAGPFGAEVRFAPQSNRTYGVFVIARDLAGNVEAKAPVAEANLDVPDIVRPQSAVSGVGLDAASGLMQVAWTGSDDGGSHLAFVELYAALRGGSPWLVDRAPAGRADGAGGYAGTFRFQALADGQRNDYDFFTVGTDAAGNVERRPDSPDRSFSAPVAYPTAGAAGVTAFTVQKGLAGRSFVRHVDLLLNRRDIAAAIADTLANSDPRDDRLALTRFGLDGVSGATDVPLAGRVAALDAAIALDFGDGGITGNPRSAAGDGYYVLSADLDGDGTRETTRTFYRLLGDVDRPGVPGAGVVDDADLAAIAADAAAVRRGQGLATDVTGDGVVDATDRAVVQRLRGRRLAGTRRIDG